MAFQVASVLNSKDKIKQNTSVDNEINSWFCCNLLQEVVQKYDTPSPLSHLLHLRWFMATGALHSERLISYMWRLHLELRLTCRISPALCLIKVETETVSARELFMEAVPVEITAQWWAFTCLALLSTSIKIFCSEGHYMSTYSTTGLR